MNALAPRADFPVLSREVDGNPVVYLDNAATSLKPKSVISTVTRYYEHVGANIHRGKHMLSEEASESFEAARRRLARFFSVQTNELVLTHNATHALNLVASGLPLPEGARVLVCSDAHHSALLPLRRRARVDVVDLAPSREATLARFEEALSSRPSAVVLTHCSNVSGVYWPVRELSALAKRAGAAVIVDAAQSAPHERISLASLGADFVAIAGHKMLGPTGTGLLLGDVERLSQLEPTFIGGGTVDWVDREVFRWRGLPHRLEAGTPHIAGFIGLAAAAAYLDELDMTKVAAHDEALGAALRRHVARRPTLELVGPLEGERQAALVSVRIPSVPSLGDLARSLSDAYGVMARSGYLCAQPYVSAVAGSEVLRLSAYVYNTEAEVDRAFDALDELVAAYT